MRSGRRNGVLIRLWCVVISMWQNMAQVLVRVWHYSAHVMFLRMRQYSAQIRLVEFEVRVCNWHHGFGSQILAQLRGELQFFDAGMVWSWMLTFGGILLLHVLVSMVVVKIFLGLLLGVVG